MLRKGAGRTLRIGLVLAALLVVGCAVGPQPPTQLTAEEVEAGTTVEHDTFKRVTTYVGPPAFRGARSSVRLRAWGDLRGPATNFQIYVVDVYDGRGWKFLERAYDRQGRRLDATVIARDVGVCSGRGLGCSHHEHIGVRVDRAYLMEAVQRTGDSEGIELKIEGAGGHNYLFLPSAYVLGFLAALNR